MFKVRSLVGGLALIALCIEFTVACGSSDAVRTKNATVVAGTSCAKAGLVKTFSGQPNACAKTSSGLKWYGVNNASGSPVKCAALGQLRRRSSIIWVCGKDGKKTIWKATLPLPDNTAGFVTTVPGASPATSVASLLESTSPSAGAPKNDALSNTSLTDESLNAVVRAEVLVDESKPWILAASNDADPAARDFATDTLGNAYALGSFCGDRISFGGKMMVGNERGGSDCSITLSKVTPSGSVQWNTVINGDGGQNWGESVVANAGGEVFMTGFFAGTKITSGDFSLDAENAGYNSFLLKLNSDGVVQWGKILGGKTTKDIKFDWSLDLTGNGSNLFVVGLIDGVNKTVKLDDYSVESGSANDMFIAKLSTETGVAEWLNSYPVSTPYLKNNAVADASGNVYVTASFTAATFSINTSLATTLTNAQSGTSDILVMKIDKSGQPMWAVRVGAEGNEDAGNISLTRTGVVVSGNFESTKIVVNATNLTKVGAVTGFVTHLTSAGAFGQSFATPASLRLAGSEGSIAEDSAGNVYLSGAFTGSFSIGSKTLTTGKGTYDAFLVKMSSSGETLWGQQFGNTGNTGAAYVQADDAGASLLFDTGAKTDAAVGTVTVKSGLILMRAARSGVLP